MKADVAVLTTRANEFKAVLRRFQLSPQRGTSGRTYGIASVPSKGEKCYTVAIATSSEDDNDASQQLTNDIIRDLDPTIILVVGIGQGVPHDEFTLGDVIISSRIHNFNAGAFVTSINSEFDVKGGIHPLVSDITANLPLYALRLDGWNSPESCCGLEGSKAFLSRQYSHESCPCVLALEEWRSQISC